MSSDFSTPALVDYLDPELILESFPVDRHLQEHTVESARPMSPVPSAASTPPVSTSATAAFSANNANATSDVANHYETTMNSFSTPVSLAAAPYPTMSIGPFPQRAEHSYGYHPMPMHQHNPYSAMGAPPAPPPGSVQRPRGPPLTTTTIVQPLQQSMMDTPSSSTPDAPPAGAGGARKRPKYTRSKKGCLTCRSKKIKCDERKPLCTRCEHGHRECTWPEAVLPRRPKGAVRGVGNEGEEEADDGRRNSIPGSAVSTQFPPSSTTSSHFPGMGNNSPFEPTPSRRDGLDSDVFPTGSQFPLSSRSFYPRAPLSAPGGEFYPMATVNGQPLEDYEFPPRQSFGAGPSSGTNVSRGSYSNGNLFAVAPGSAASPYNDLRRASWDSSAPTDGRRPSWDTTSMQGGTTLPSSGSSPAGSSLGLGGVNRGAASGALGPGGSMSGSSGGGAAGAGGANGLMLLHSPDPLSPFFRSVQERNLIKHYCHSSANIIMALPPTPNPILAVTLPIVLDKPPGTHAPTEALRLALLGVGAVHMAYLTSRRRVCVGVGAVGPSDVVSPMNLNPDVVGGESDAARMMGLSSMLRLGATKCLAVACRNPEETRSDAALGATMAVTLIDIFSGGHQWMRNINLAKTLIALRGGPASILNTNLPKQARFGGGVTVSPARFWLEMLAVYETFGSLTSGEEPTLLAPGNNDWWFDDAQHSYHANSIEKVFGMARSMVTLIAKVSAFLCRAIRERAVITENDPDLGASIVQLPDDLDMPDIEMTVPAPDVTTATITEAIDDDDGAGADGIPDFDFEKFLNDFGATPTALGDGFISGPIVPDGAPSHAALTPRFVDGDATVDVNTAQAQDIGSAPGLTFATNTAIGQYNEESGETTFTSGIDPVRLANLRGFFQDAKALYCEIESWEDNVGPEQREARVLVGNKTHKLAMMIIMLRDVFHVPRMDPRVQSFAASILDLCLESSQQNMGVDLTWPVIIAGCQVMTPDARLQVAQAFDSFRKQCCFEIESSERIVAEVWRRVDAGEPRDDWRAVVEDEGLRILVL